MRKIIAYFAVSADGFIARPDGAVEWLDRPRTAGDYGMGRFYRSIDTVIMGRKTWDLGRRLGQPAYAGKANYVFSHTRLRTGDPRVTLVHERVKRFANFLRRRPGLNIWLVVGADLFGAFLDAGQVDEIVAHVIPTLIGEGIPLFAPRHRSVPLRLLGSRRFADGVVRLHYAVLEPAPRRRRSSRDRGPARG